MKDQTANQRQVGGDHYKGDIQHWDLAAARGYDYFQGQITKYVDRWKKKGGIADLKKAQHFLQKYIELEESNIYSDRPTNINDARCGEATQASSLVAGFANSEKPSPQKPDAIFRLGETIGRGSMAEDNARLRALVDSIPLNTEAPNYAKAQELDDAKQVQSTGKHDASSGSQSQVCQKGRRSYDRS